MDLRQKRILVTGGGGFLGGHLLKRLRRLGAAEISAPRHRDADLTERAAVERLLRERRPQVVFHLAARVGGIGANRRQPASFLYDNLIMGVELIEAARRAEVEKTVVVGTVCSYPKHTPVPFREDALWDGYPEETNAPYGIAKKLLIVQLQAYRQQYGFTGVCPILVNLYGPGDHFDPRSSHVIPALITRFDAARRRGSGSVTVWGTGDATREFLYVEDAARALVLAAERLDSPEPVNVGSGEEISIGDLAALVARTVGYRGRIRFDRAQPDGQPRRRLDTGRARERIGFRARVGLERGLEMTVDWFRSLRCSTAAGRAAVA
jgi:GDP-L-fucose synthase